MRSHWQPNCNTGASIMEVLYFEFSLYSLFLQYTPKLLNIFLYSTLLPYIPQEYTPTPLLSTHSTMALTKTSSIIKTRAQSRTEARTGTKVRTNDDTIAPAPPATGRTIGPTNTVVTTTDPVATPVTDDLFAGRPKTGALKDPPPVAVPVSTGKQVPRDSDSDDDANKKPAAKPTKPKPKGRPKKVAPKATRKPRKPCTTVDPNELVDPMANIHVGDATGVVTAGGLARAGGYDPVLANPEQDPEQPEPQPKKTRRAVDRSRASRANCAGHGNDDDDEDSYDPVGTGTTGGYGNGGNGGGDDDDYDDFDPDADSIVDSQGVPEAPGA